MRRVLLISALLLSAGCATPPASPLVAGRSYYLKLSTSNNGAEVDVLETVGDWVRIRYRRNSPQPYPGAADG